MSEKEEKKTEKRYGFVIKFFTKNTDLVSMNGLKQSFFRELRFYPLYGGQLGPHMQYELMMTLPKLAKKNDFSNVEIEIREFDEKL